MPVILDGEANRGILLEWSPGPAMQKAPLFSHSPLHAVALAVSMACGCSGSVDYSPKPGLISLESMKIQRVTAGEPSLLWFDLVLSNKTSHHVQNFYFAGFAATAGADFDISPPMSTVGCVTPDPWDVPAGGTKAVRMRLDLRKDPAELGIACSFDPTMAGFDFLSSRVYHAPLVGAPLSSDFAGPMMVRLKANLQAPCSPDDCQTPALVEGSGAIGMP
jgi:hypothetical protein